MQVKELYREKTQSGETVVEFEAGKLHVRLISTYGGNTLDELLYAIACRKFTERNKLSA